MELQTLVETLSEYGVTGVITAAVILIAVFLAKKSGLVATGDHARIANVILGAILFGLTDDPESANALMAVLSSVLAGLAYEALEYLSKGNKLFQR